MKAVLMAIHPEWCEKIFSGEKTIEVRKVAPKLKTPYKAYVYETQGATETPWVDEDGHFIWKGRGQVVGEFVCDENERFAVGSLRCDEIEELACLSYQEMIEYFYKPEELDGKTVKAGTALHITKPKRYDTPKALSEFRKPDVWYKTETGNTSTLVHETGTTITRPPQSWMYVEEIEE